MFQKNGEKARFRSTQNPIKITIRKSLKIKYHFSAKIQGIYFKIQGTYFKISALYFLQHALCFLWGKIITRLKGLNTRNRNNFVVFLCASELLYRLTINM